MPDTSYAVNIIESSGRQTVTIIRAPSTAPVGSVHLSFPVTENNNDGPLIATITGATNATPIVLTATAHGMSDGDQVLVKNVGGNTNANGVFTLASTSANAATLVGSVGNATYTSGGTMVRLAKFNSFKHLMQAVASAIYNDKAAGN